MDRRHFLSLLAGAVVASGCGGGGSGGSDLVVVPNDWDFFAGGLYRLSVLLASTKHNGAPVSLTAPVTLQVGDRSGAFGPPLETVIHADGPEPSYALTAYRFPSPGSYQLKATYRGATASAPITVTNPATSTVPVAGDPLPAVKTPTVGAPMGVAAVCTASPACPFHAVSLDAAVVAHQPVALLFATPAFCQSKFCGPVLDNLVAVHAPWASRVTFIHCEIYSDASGTVETQPVTEFRLQHEPMLYLAGGDGLIVTRVDNLFDKGEAHDALTAAFGPA